MSSRPHVVGVTRQSVGRYPLKGQRAACLRAGAGQVLEIGPDGTLEQIARDWTDQHRVVVQHLFLVSGVRKSAVDKRANVLLFVELVARDGGEVYEESTGRSSLDDDQRREMISDALQACTRGQQPAQGRKRGRPARPAATRDQAKALWFSREFKTWPEVDVELRKIGWSAATAYHEWRGRGELKKPKR